MVTFDGSNKLITCDPGITLLDVRRLYSMWKEWAATNNNLGYIKAFSVVGGEPTVGSNIITPYFFLANGWKIQPDSADHSLSVSGILLVEGGGEPFVKPAGNWMIAINAIVPIYTETILVNPELTKQDVRDALALPLSNDESININSIENKVNRIDKNTQS